MLCVVNRVRECGCWCVCFVDIDIWVGVGYVVLGVAVQVCVWCAHVDGMMLCAVCGE